MTTLTITVSGEKAGEQIFFILNIPKSNFLKVVDMTWNNVDDVLKGESEGYYSISK